MSQQLQHEQLSEAQSILPDHPMQVTAEVDVCCALLLLNVASCVSEAAALLRRAELFFIGVRSTLQRSVS